MSTVTRPEVREGYFPQWRLKTTGVIMPEERLPWGQTLVSGLQHGVAMSGGTIIGPLIMGFDPGLALLFSGLGTLIFFVVVAGRVPSYLGSSFSFIAVVIAASGYSGHGPNPNLDVALGGIIAAGMLYGVIALGTSKNSTGAPRANQIHVSRHRQRGGLRWDSRAFSISTSVSRRSVPRVIRSRHSRQSFPSRVSAPR